MPTKKAPTLIPAPPGGQPGQTAPRWPIPGSSTAPSGPFDPLKMMVNDVAGSYLPFLRTQSDQVTKGVDLGMAGLPLIGGIGAMLRNYLATAHGIEPALAHSVAQGFTEHIGQHLGIAPNMPAEFAPVGGEASFNAQQPATKTADPREAAKSMAYDKVMATQAAKPRKAKP